MNQPSASEGDPLPTDLTEPQRQAVCTVEGPVLVLAAAGSGKTRVITRRAIHLVRNVGIPPWQILAITFTNKAAGEMRHRIQQELDAHQANVITVGTFHSFCARTLRRCADLAHLNPNFTIYDAADQKRALKQAYKDLDIAKETYPIDRTQTIISHAKNRLQTPETYAQQAGNFQEKRIAQLYKRYQRILTDNAAVDFDDLLMHTGLLLANDPTACRELQERYQYLMIDEYQDTNHAQFMIASLIAGQRRNLFAVGDPDQSIYAWRGADLNNILDFEHHFPDAKVITLGQNYRSTPQILEAADHLIQHNKFRKHKPLFTDNPPGDPIHIHHLADEQDEAQHVVEWFKQLHHQKQRPWSEMAVFYRLNALSRTMEEALLRENIPYQIARGTAFYQRAEVRDVIAYLKVLANPADAIGIQRIINMPARGIGKTTVDRLVHFAVTHHVSLSDAIGRAEQITTLNNRAAAAVQRFAALFDNWSNAMDAHAKAKDMFTPGMADLVDMIIKDSKLESHYRNKDEEKLENVKEMVNAAARFDQEYANPDADWRQQLQDYLESISLVSDIDATGNTAGAVTLMTLHSAKGLEFDAVAMIGLEQNILPHARANDDPEELEEERRLCFVGMTRARKQLIMTHTGSRMQRGITERAVASQFLFELPETVQYHKRQFGDTGYFNNPRATFSTATAGTTPAAKTDNPYGIATGMQVRHATFGIGRVLGVSGTGALTKARVRFNTVGVKTLMLEYAKLEIN